MVLCGRYDDASTYEVAIAPDPAGVPAAGGARPYPSQTKRRPHEV